jgi:hypothetical protein
MSLYRNTYHNIEQFVPISNYNYLIRTYLLAGVNIDSIITSSSTNNSNKQTAYFRPTQSTIYLAQSSLSGHKLISTHKIPSILGYNDNNSSSIIQSIENRKKKPYEANIIHWETNKNYFREEYNRIKMQARVYNNNNNTMQQ